MENLKNEPEIGRRIRALRKAKGLLQKQLAAVAGMEVPQLWSIENDRNSPSIKTLARIASALSVTTAELLSEPCSDFSDAKTKMQLDYNPSKGSDLFDEIQIIRHTERDKIISTKDVLRMKKAMSEAAVAEARQQVDIPTSLPLAFPINVNEGGAEQLAHFLRAHLDIGSAVLRNVFSLFENHGIRILKTASLKGKREAATFYSRKRRDFTIFLAKSLEDKQWRKEFVFLTEIGYAFVFASKKFETFTETAKSRRFAHHFAATFLQPASAVRMAVYSLRIKPDDWTFELLLRLKDRFGVSAESFNIRLKELSLITMAKCAEFEKRIKEYYKEHDFDEPMPDGNLPENRLGDLASLAAE